jgi:formylglycine-generating enzyme required for sulfatase activity
MTTKSKPLRGGGSRYSAEDAPGGTTLWALPTSDHENIGFRLVCDDAHRVNRGGSWLSTAGGARAAGRGRSYPGGRFDLLGLRVVKDTA